MAFQIDVGPARLFPARDVPPCAVQDRMAVPCSTGVFEADDHDSWAEWRNSLPDVQQTGKYS